MKENEDMIEWKTDDSILAFLAEHIDSEGNLKESGYKLPDETEIEGGFSFAPGLMDTMYGTDDLEDTKQKVDELTHLLSLISKKKDTRSQSDFYKLVTEYESVIEIIDDFLQQFSELDLRIDPHLYDFAKKMATKTDNRNSVKVGIAILGFCENPEPLEDIKMLGLHDEFTVFSTVALLYLSPDPMQDLWELAKHVDGWGKIQLVERLTEMELPTEIQDWLLLEGFKNNIMYEYLALTCAQYGKLDEKLAHESVDPRFFKSASEIIEALISEGPVAGISAYTDAASTLESYIHHTQSQELDISNFLILHLIKDFLLEVQEDPSEHESNGWTEDIISNCLIDVVGIISSRNWAEDAMTALTSADDTHYWNGKQAARKLGIDIWDILWKRLQSHPIDSTAWFDITQFAKPIHVDKLITYALEVIPLQEISTGPLNTPWFGPDFDKYQSHEFVITFLGDYPQKGEEILLVGLSSHVTRNRFMTLKTLEKWGADNWSDQLKEGLEKLKEIEPDEDIKENVVRLLRGEEIE